MKTMFIAICVVITASAHATDTEQRARGAQLVQQAASYPYLFRQGDTATAAKAVALLEEATRLDPDDAEAWTALGVAHQMQLSAAISGGKPATLLELAQRVRADYERALQLDPDHAAALAGHGSILTILAGLRREPRWFGQGQAEMNRAVQLQPSAVRPRLLRAFTSVNLPASMRELPAIENDVRFLIDVAGVSRPAAMLHVLKPVNRERLAQAVERAGRLLANPAEAATDQSRVAAVVQTLQAPLRFVVGRSRERYLLIPIEEVCFFQVSDGLTKVKTAGTLYRTDYGLNELEQRLPAPPFVRAHRSTLVNLGMVAEIAPLSKGSYVLLMKDQQRSELTVSERQSKWVRELLKL